MEWQPAEDATFALMVLVDSSVWIDFLRKGRSQESAVLNALIVDERDIAICGMIRQEVLQGIQDDLLWRRIGHVLDQTHYLSLDEPQTFDTAAQIYRALRKRGKTIRTAGDCLIAAVAIQYHLDLLHRDRDFQTIARYTDLRIYQSSK